MDNFIKLLAQALVQELARNVPPGFTNGTVAASVPPKTSQAQGRHARILLQCGKCHKRNEQDMDTKTGVVMCSYCGHIWKRRPYQAGRTKSLTGMTVHGHG